MVGESKSKGRVLVVDDDPILRQLFKRNLEKLGVEAVVVADGAGAQDAVQTESFDLVLMDQHLTGERGTELTARLRGEASSSAKWVCISGSIRGHQAESLANFDGSAEKPATVEEMRRLLREWLPDGTLPE